MEYLRHCDSQFSFFSHISQVVLGCVNEEVWHFPLSTAINIAQQVVQTDPTASSIAKTRC